MADVVGPEPKRVPQRGSTSSQVHPGDTATLEDQLLYVAGRLILSHPDQAPRTKVRFYDGAATRCSLGPCASVRSPHVPSRAHSGFQVPAGPELLRSSLEQDFWLRYPRNSSE
jgi:hypothetical protein